MWEPWWKGGRGGRGTPYHGLYWEAPPERGIFFRLHEYERLGISLVKVYKKVGKICQLGLWEASKGLADEFDGFINARKRSIFAIIPK